MHKLCSKVTLIFNFLPYIYFKVSSLHFSGWQATDKIRSFNADEHMVSELPDSCDAIS